MSFEDKVSSFTEWMKQVDQELTRVCGLSHLDLGDVDYWNMWDSGDTPAEAARECLEENNFPFPEGR